MNSATQELVKEITDTLWTYEDVKRVVNRNYIVLQAIVRNTVKSLGINENNFDVQSFIDSFDIYELDLNSQDTFVDSLSKVLSKFIVHDEYDNIDKAMEMAPYEIESRLREVLDYLRKNPGDNETIEYAKELINQLREFNRDLARRYENELSLLLSPKPVETKVESETKPEIKIESEPKPVIRIETKSTETKVDDNNVLKPVTESRLRQIRNYKELRPKLVELREVTTRALEELRKQREDEIHSIEVVLFEVFRTLRNPRETRYWDENVELARNEIERLRQLDPERADRYERELEKILSEREPKAKVHVNRGKIIAYILPEKLEKPKVNDVNAVDVEKILRPVRSTGSKPRSVKTDVNTKITVKKPGLLQRIRYVMDVIGKDFVNMYYMYYYRSRSR